MTRNRLVDSMLAAIAAALALTTAGAAGAFVITGCLDGSGAGPALNDFGDMPYFCGNAVTSVGETGSGFAMGGPLPPYPASFSDFDPASLGQIAADFDLTSTAFGESAPGVLRALSEAHSLLGNTVGGAAADAAAHTKVAFWDYGTIVSPTLAPGTPVTVELTIDAGVSTAGSFASALVLYSVRGPATIDGPGDTIGGATPSLHRVIDFSAAVGQTLAFDMFLEADATAGRNEPPFDLDSVADATNTGRFFVDVLTPGAGFAAQSGHDYSIAVPEPATPLLLGAGLATLGLLSRLDRPALRRGSARSRRARGPGRPPR